jgi:hypothetical protein
VTPGIIQKIPGSSFLLKAIEVTSLPGRDHARSHPNPQTPRATALSVSAGNGERHAASREHMKKICLLTCITVLSWIGWWLGERFGFMTAYLLGFLGSLAGVYVGCRINRDYLS